MKFKYRAILRAEKTLYCSGVVGILLAVSALANVTNTIPFQDSFEKTVNAGYTNGALFKTMDVNGWYTSDDTMIVTQNYSYAMTPPIPPTSAHTNVMKLDSGITNLVTSANMVQYDFTYVDMLLQPSVWDETTNPDVQDSQITNGVLTSVYFNSSNKHVYVWGSAAVAPGDRHWIEMPNFTVTTGQWLRLTIDVAWDGTGFGDNFFRVRLNGTLQNCYEGDTMPPTTSTGHEWILSTTGYGRTKHLNSVAFKGSGYVDDFQVVSANPLSTVSYNVLVSSSNSGTFVAQTVNFWAPPAEGTVAVESNNSTVVKWYTDVAQKKEGYMVTNVIVDGSPVGLTNEYPFNNVESDHTLVVLTQPEKRTLQVISPYGSPSPSGTTTYDYNTPIQCNIGGSPIFSGTKTQIVCAGWSRTGPTTDSGSGTNAPVFYIGGPTNNTTTNTWLWTTNCLLNVTSNGNGTVVMDIESGWYDIRASATIEAKTNGTDAFTGWTGDTNEFSNTNGLFITVPMTQTRAIIASFEGSTPFTSRGTPTNWIHQFYPTTNDYEHADTDDTDLDGSKTFEEYIAGTDPTDAGSVFRIIDSGFTNGSFYMRFYGTTNSGVLSDFGVRRSSDLLGSWGSIYGLVGRTNQSGTNMFIDPSAPGGAYFYRPAATNN